MLWLYILDRIYNLRIERNFGLSFRGMLWFMISVSWVENRSTWYRADELCICAWNLGVWESESVYGKKQKSIDGYGGSTRSFESLSVLLVCPPKASRSKLHSVLDFYLFAHFYCMHVCAPDACGEGTCIRGCWENNFVEFKDRIRLSSLAQQVPLLAEPSRQPLEFYF